MAAWEETSGDESRSFVFVGIDGEARDAVELDRFKRDLNSDAVYEGEDPNTARYRGGSGTSRSAGIGIVGSAMAVAVAVGGAAAGSAAFLAIGAAGACASVGSLLWIHATKSRAPTSTKFELTFTPTGLRIGSSESLDRTEYPLDDIQAFEGAARLVLIRKNAERVPLRPTLPRRVDTEQLAARLNETLIEARRWSGGYR